MRIISGTLKGRKLNFIKNSTTRPLKDSVRENIFNILIHSSHIKTKIINSNVLDLYSHRFVWYRNVFQECAKKSHLSNTIKKHLQCSEKI